MADETVEAFTPSVFATATKFTAPPMCREANAAATLHPSCPNSVIGMNLKDKTVATTVDTAPTKNAWSIGPASLRRGRVKGKGKGKG